MKTLSRLILSSLALILIAVTALPVGAQADDTQTVTLSEAALSAAASQAAANGDTPIASLSLNLRDMEIEMIAGGTRPNGQAFNIEAVIVPSVVDHRLYWTLASFEVVNANGIVSPRDPASGQATGRFIDVWEHAYNSVLIALLLPYMEQDNIYRLRVNSVTITEDALTLEYQKGVAEQRETANPDSATAGLDGTSNTIMLTEAQANDAFAAIARRNERIESATVDFTPQGLKVEAQIVTPGGQTVGIIAILIGLVVDPGKQGYLQWTLEDVLISGVAAGDVNGDAIGEIITTAWSRFVDLQLKSSGNEVAIETIEFTNTTMIIAILIGL